SLCFSRLIERRENQSRTHAALAPPQQSGWLSPLIVRPTARPPAIVLLTVWVKQRDGGGGRFERHAITTAIAKPPRSPRATARLNRYVNRRLRPGAPRIRRARRASA
ncbi:MAG TPA: hypothetical protein VEZ40_08510, partial [Pyrinomonadaceae bacterium]|nr:hypothetical protein [Pyrinomonadaceae bacterium]